MPSNPFTLKVTSVSTVEIEDGVYGFAVGLKLYHGDEPYSGKCNFSINTENADVPMVGIDDYGRIVGIKTSENGDDVFAIGCALDGGISQTVAKLSIGSFYGKKAGDVLSSVS